MKRTFYIFLATLSLSSAGISQQLPADQAAMRAHVAYLASDELKGREAGTPEYDRAAAYVADQMARAGLKPAGDAGSWFQKVPLLASRASAEPSMTMNGTPLVFGVDFTLRGSSASATIDVSAPVVFAGYGVVDAATGRDDYRGLDVRGKIVAIFFSGPKGLNSEVAAHLGSREDRLRQAAAHGAVGVIMLWTDQIDGMVPFARLAAGWDDRGLSWTDPDGTRPNAGAPLLAIMSFAGAEKLFAGAPVAWRTVREDDTAGRPATTGPLAPTVAMRKRYDLERLSSSNVVGRLQGSDPDLADQVVILSAHLDHIGVTKSVSGDTINNGAMDNAAGVASLLEVARLFKAQKTAPRRSVLFLVVTAEEKGLVGSDFYATHSTVPTTDIVANVNLDMPVLTYRFIDLIAFGAERSGIGPVVAQVAKGEGLALTPDPAPAGASFVRTDHYSFVRQGIPAISLQTGPGGPGKAAFQDFLAHHYHQPSDDMSLPFDWAAGRKFVKVNYLIARTIADAADRPRWVKGDYFGTLYKGPMEP
jgi:hypothetical protein